MLTSTREKIEKMDLGTVLGFAFVGVVLAFAVRPLLLSIFNLF